MILFTGLFSIFLACRGIYNNIRNKHLIVFIWIIVLYYCVTSLVAIYTNTSDYMALIPDSIKVKYMLNLFLCISGFYFSDIVFNKKTALPINFKLLKSRKILFKIEMVFWISYLLTFRELSSIDYETYTNDGGAGWAQVIFMLTSGIIFYYCFCRSWWKIIIAFLMMGIIISSTGVRSLMFYIIMPIGFYYLYTQLHTIQHFGQFLRKSLPFMFVMIICIVLVEILRFGSVHLPETELTNIALRCMDEWEWELQYFISVIHYFLGLFTPVNNVLMKIGIYWLDILSTLMPSIPKLNALIYSGAIDTSFIDAYHMPATIFFNFYVSWGNFACVAAFFTYCFFLKVFSAMQVNGFRIMLFSPMLGWHFYMVMRGASDTAAKGIAFPLLLGVFFCYLIERKDLKF